MQRRRKTEKKSGKGMRRHLSPILLLLLRLLFLFSFAFATRSCCWPPLFPPPSFFFLHSPLLEETYRVSREKKKNRVGQCGQSFLERWRKRREREKGRRKIRIELLTQLSLLSGEMLLHIPKDFFLTSSSLLTFYEIVCSRRESKDFFFSLRYYGGFERKKTFQSF